MRPKEPTAQCGADSPSLTLYSTHSCPLVTHVWLLLYHRPCPCRFAIVVSMPGPARHSPCLSLTLYS